MSIHLIQPVDVLKSILLNYFENPISFANLDEALAAAYFSKAKEQKQPKALSILQEATHT